jgi:hypothetical protein
MNIQVSRLGCIVLSDCISTTGKYYCFYGQHLVNGFPCYDVAALARTGETQGVAIRRHFNDPSLSPEMNKANAIRFWDEFREKMTTPRPDDLSDEPKGRMGVGSELEDISEYLN